MKKVKIGDVCDILNGFAFKSDKYVEKGIRIIRIANVQKGFIEDNVPTFYPMDSTGLEKYMLKEDDLLMSLTGNVGRVALLQKEMLPAALNQRVACLRLKTDRITKGFLFHILNSDFFEQQCVLASNGVAQKNMSTEWLKDYEIPLYSIQEQMKIADILDKTKRIIVAKNNELRALNELIKARFVEMFGDPVLNDKKFSTLSGEDFFKLSNGKAVPEEKRHEVGIPAYGGNGISWYTNEVLRVEDTLVVGRVGFQSGNVHYAVGPLWITDNAMYISQYDKGKINLGFLCELMQRVNFSRFQDAGDLKKITQKPFMSFQYILPSMELQQKFVDFKEQIDKSKVAIQKSLDETQILFDSLMQKYFG